MKVLILGGVGAVGIEATRDFVKTSKADVITIADYNIDKALRLVDELSDERVDAIKVDVNNIEELKKLMSGYDYVINALPFKYDYIVTKLAVELGISGVDVASEEDQFELHDIAVRNSALFVPGVGATPGTTNLMAKKAAHMLDEVDTIEIFWAAFRCTAPSPGLLYVTIWEFDPNLKERVVYENGEWRSVPPFYGAKEATFFPLIGRRLTVCVPHSETYTLPRYLGKPVKNVYVRGTWPDETMNLLKTLLYYGFYDNNPIEVNGIEVRPMDFIYKFLLSSPHARETEIWGYGLLVHATGVKEGVKARAVVWNEHPHPDAWGGRRAYFKNIGIPLSIGMQLIIEEYVDIYGVLPPEAVYDPDRFFQELSKRDIKIHSKLEFLQ